MPIWFLHVVLTTWDLASVLWASSSTSVPLSGEEPEWALQELHLPLPSPHRQTQPLFLRQAALCRRDQQRHSREAHLQPCSRNGESPSCSFVAYGLIVVHECVSACSSSNTLFVSSLSGASSSPGWDVSADRGYCLPLQQSSYAAGGALQNPAGPCRYWERHKV